MEKKLLRHRLLETREALSWLEIQGKSHQVAQFVLQLRQYRQARTLLIYLPFRKEIDTMPIMKTAWQQHKQVLIPVCRPKKELLLSRLSNLDELAPGAYGIPEPKKECFHTVSADQVDLALLPGVAFDLKGHRLGYGGGYFDRFLPSLRPDCVKLALAYDFQIVDKLPAKEHDIRMDIIVTESKLIEIG